MVEPTETQSRETVEALATALLDIAGDDPDAVRASPVRTPSAAGRGPSCTHSGHQLGSGVTAPGPGSRVRVEVVPVADSSRLVRVWRASGEPWGAVLIVHGLGEHCGADRTASAFATLPLRSLLRPRGWRVRGKRGHAVSWDVFVTARRRGTGAASGREGTDCALRSFRWGAPSPSATRFPTARSPTL